MRESGAMRPPRWLSCVRTALARRISRSFRSSFQTNRLAVIRVTSRRTAITASAQGMPTRGFAMPGSTLWRRVRELAVLLPVVLCWARERGSADGMPNLDGRRRSRCFANPDFSNRRRNSGLENDHRRRLERRQRRSQSNGGCALSHRH
jgi:hypothetical protein